MVDTEVPGRIDLEDAPCKKLYGISNLIPPDIPAVVTIAEKVPCAGTLSVELRPMF
jgi:hypothetical protein